MPYNVSYLYANSKIATMKYLSLDRFMVIYEEW